jgi:hypothetical protein
MNTDMSNLQGCDEFEENQVLVVPIMSQTSMEFWTKLLNQKSKATIGLELAFRSDGNACYVISTHREKAGDVWNALGELIPTFYSLCLHDKLMHFSGTPGKIRSH